MKKLIILPLLIFVSTMMAQTDQDLQSLLKGKQYAEVATKGQRMIDAGKATAKTYATMAAAYRLMEQWDKVEKHSYKALEMDQKLPEAHFEKGMFYAHKGIYELAVTDFQTCLELSGSQHYAAGLELGRMYILQEDHHKALAQLKSVKSDNHEPEIFKLLAVASYSTGDFSMAMVYLNMYQGMEGTPPLNAGLLLMRARCYAATGDPEKSLSTYLEAEKLEPNDPEYLIEIADLYKEQKNYASQAAYTEKYLAAGGKADFKLLFQLGRCYYFAQDYAKADSVFGLVQQQYSQSYIGAFWRARANAKIDPTNEKGLALPYYLDALAKFKDEEKTKYKKDYIEANHYLGYYYLAIKTDMDKSKVYWNNILAVDPENGTAADALKAIGGQ